MEIRQANITDLDRVEELEQLCFPPAEAAARASLSDRLAHYPNHFWLLEDGENLVSMVNGMTTASPHLTDDMYGNAALHDEQGEWQMIFGVNTHPDYRRRGCAERLLRHVIDTAKTEGRRGLVLTCKERLIHYYAGLGFADEGISDSEHGGAVWHEMRLTLKQG